MMENKKLLSSSFLHFKGIGKKTEKKLWREGVNDWTDLAAEFNCYQLSIFEQYPQNPLVNEILSSLKALESNDADYFAQHLPKNEWYRIALDFINDTVFLDIETTGLSKYYDYITIVGWTLNNKYNFFIKGDNDSELRNALSKAKCIITFNGSIFDIPFLKKEFKNITIPETHVDLRFFSKKIGLSGGQKEIEQLLNIQRSSDIKDIDGKSATILWYKYRQGNLESLKNLIKYNYYDVMCMKIIFNEIINKIVIGENKSILSHTACEKYSKDSEILNFSLSIPEKDWQEKIIYLDNSIPSINYGNLVTNKEKIIGIDLSGSEKKASGCCILDGYNAKTSLLNSDQEIINYVVSNKPLLVSIDSPLSMPSGRTCVTDDDPVRDKFGIMRDCEKLLKKRGVNVYPSLIPSMQKLTKRGIELATHLRKLGIPVIESYPGAAQDILKIPRKRSDLEMLKKGLFNFGIKADYEVSHDELDAITSAIVGLFFWFGRFEKLGNPVEDYLIIPEIDNKVLWGNNKIIGFSGPIATGKTTASRVLEKNGFFYTRFSLILQKILEDECKDINRKTLQELGEQFKRNDQRKLCKLLYKELPKDGNIVIDGLRHPEDHAFLTEFFGPDFTHIYIESSLLERRNRYIKMGKDGQEFDNTIYHPVEGNVSNLANLAQLIIKNDSTIEDLEKNMIFEMDKIISKRGCLQCL